MLDWWKKEQKRFASRFDWWTLRSFLSHASSLSVSLALMYYMACDVNTCNMKHKYLCRYWVNKGLYEFRKFPWKVSIFIYRFSSLPELNPFKHSWAASVNIQLVSRATLRCNPLIPSMFWFPCCGIYEKLFVLSTTKEGFLMRVFKVSTIFVFEHFCIRFNSLLKCIQPSSSSLCHRRESDAQCSMTHFTSIFW